MKPWQSAVVLVWVLLTTVVSIVGTGWVISLGVPHLLGVAVGIGIFFAMCAAPVIRDDWFTE